jgi:hypothetical protein
MMKLKAITLLSTCIIAGLPRSPIEGVQTVPEDEANRLIEAGMAEDASGDVEVEDENDGLDAMKVPALRSLAADEGITLAGGANKATIIAAIRSAREDEARGNADRDHDDEGADDGLDEMTVAELRALADEEKVAIEGDANKASIVAAIRTARESQSGQ